MKPLCMCCLLVRFPILGMCEDPTMCTSAFSRTDSLVEQSSFQVRQIAATARSFVHHEFLCCNMGRAIIISGKADCSHSQKFCAS